MQNALLQINTGCGKRRKDVQQQPSVSGYWGEKLQRIKEAITLNGVCIRQSLCMHGERAEAPRAASRASLGNNCFGAMCQAPLMDNTNQPRAQLLQRLSTTTTDSPGKPGQGTHLLWGPIFLQGETDYSGWLSQGSCLFCASKERQCFCWYLP